MEKLFQVFISSAYDDFKEERRAIANTVLEYGHVPVGMEFWPAADENPLDLVKKMIEYCDYFLVVVGGRRNANGVDEKKSFTEIEYEYAKELGKPIMAFCPVDSPAPSVESRKTDMKQSAHIDFVNRLKADATPKPWADTQGLCLAVAQALRYFDRSYSAPGWIRGGGIGEQVSAPGFVDNHIESMLRTFKQAIDAMMPHGKNRVLYFAHNANDNKLTITHADERHEDVDFEVDLGDPKKEKLVCVRTFNNDCWQEDTLDDASKQKIKDGEKRFPLGVTGLCAYPVRREGSPIGVLLADSDISLQNEIHNYNFFRAFWVKAAQSVAPFVTPVA